ncbi:conjugative transposon protein TraK [Chitinophaga defluvii]|uniref:Conjugative transposon protein TraK n=1 Tax=Chitinophaga defluvii TaxID=3163343 RepID=A0ABV2T8V1_9BACT
MMEQLKNIDTAFKHIRLFSAVVIVACCVTCIYSIYTCLEVVNKTQQKIYLITNGKAIEAFAANRKDNIQVEARDHVKVFHERFFTLSPDEKTIESNMLQALYLADASAKTQYNDLKEKGYYRSVISGNVSQQVHCDSIVLDVEKQPIYFRYYGKQQIIRPTAILVRNLVTEGFLRDLKERSDNNPHGFLIERWATLSNYDLETIKR